MKYEVVVVETTTQVHTVIVEADTEKAAEIFGWEAAMNGENDHTLSLETKLVGSDVTALYANRLKG